jgi:hypothetical protein
MIYRPHVHCSLSVCFVLFLFADTAVGGDLTPPAGPVAPTPGPNAAAVVNSTNTPGDASNAFIISMPGSYRLDRPLIHGGPQTAIRITAPNVRLDLGGFSMTGSSGVGLDGDGIVIDVNTAGGATVTIENGNINGFAHGVRVQNMPANGASPVILDSVNTSGNDLNGVFVQSARVLRLNGVTSSNNGGTGVEATSTAVNAQGLNASDNTGRGVNAGPGSELDGLTTNDNDLDGTRALDGSRLTNIKSQNNGLAGINAPDGKVSINGFTTTGNAGDGILGGPDMTINNGQTIGNGLDGINAPSGVGSGITTRNNNRGVAATGAMRLRDSRASGNKSVGFNLGPDSSLDGCEADGNATGANLGDRSNVAHSSFTNNTASGLIGGLYTNVSYSTASNNPQFGYSLGQFSCIHHSDAFFNGNGISLGGGSRVSESRAGSNGVGIRAAGAATIQHNSLSANTIGVRIINGASGSQITANFFKSHIFTGPAVLLEANNTLVTSNHFFDNTTEVTDMGTSNKVAPIQCDLSTAGPYANWNLDPMR